jgi:hypothetical protein
VFVDNDDSFLDGGIHLVEFSLIDKEYLLCSERLRWGVITFRIRRPFMDRSMVNKASHDFRVKSL